jgi:hypothetical protein
MRRRYLNERRERSCHAFGDRSDRCRDRCCAAGPDVLVVTCGRESRSAFSLAAQSGLHGPRRTTLRGDDEARLDAPLTSVADSGAPRRTGPALPRLQGMRVGRARRPHMTSAEGWLIIGWNVQARPRRRRFLLQLAHRQLVIEALGAATNSPLRWLGNQSTLIVARTFRSSRPGQQETVMDWRGKSKIKGSSWRWLG